MGMNPMMGGANGCGAGGFGGPQMGMQQNGFHGPAPMQRMKRGRPDDFVGGGSEPKRQYWE